MKFIDWYLYIKFYHFYFQIAVAPQPQKRSSQHRHSIKEEPPKFRSPWQCNPTPTSSIPSSRSGNRLNRMSSEVFVDGPSPLSPCDTERVSILEDELHELKAQINRSVSRQTFNPVSEAQRLMMNEIVEKETLCGQLQARVQVLASKLERQQMEFDDVRSTSQKETKELRNKVLTLKKKLVFRCTFLLIYINF